MILLLENPYRLHETISTEELSKTIKFLYAKGKECTATAPKSFEAKVTTHVLYDAQLGQFPNYKLLETVPNRFLWLIFHVPECVPKLSLRLETGSLK